MSPLQTIVIPSAAPLPAYDDPTLQSDSEGLATLAAAVSPQDFGFIPAIPQVMSQTGISDGSIEDLILKTLYARGETIGRELAWAVGLKQSAGFSRLIPSVFTVAMMIASFSLLNVALASLPLGTVYAVWTGIGTIGVAASGIALFGESMAWGRLLCIAFIVVGITGLRLTSRT